MIELVSAVGIMGLRDENKEDRETTASGLH